MAGADAGQERRSDVMSDSGVHERTFTRRDQEWFANVSGDHNPIHVDPDAARRLLFGQPVVHGMHVVLWAIDTILHDWPGKIAGVRATFKQPVFLEERVLVRCDDGPGDLHLRVVLRDGTEFVSARLSRSSLANESDVRPATVPRVATMYAPSRPRDRSGEADLRGVCGVLEAGWHNHELIDAFPAAARCIGEGALHHLVALSRLVGMECPGKHSIFTGLDVRIVDNGDRDRCSWEVVRNLPRLAAVRVKVADGHLEGTVNAVVRPAPVRQPATAELQGLVEPREFEGIRVLVAGGSRGLGELAAKLLSAGGSIPTVTWNQGYDEAQAVVDDITASGGRADLLRLDVADPETGLTAAGARVDDVSHLLYFASPRIAVRRTKPFDTEDFDRLLQVYVHGFVRTVEALNSATRGSLSVFYPSTVYVKEPPTGLIEYAAAKTAGELAAHEMVEGYPWLRVHIERLPRLETDQTASLVTEEPVDTPAVLLECLRLFFRPVDSKLRWRVR